MQYMHRAACRDCAEAQFLLAGMYEDYQTRDPIRSAYWYEQAAMQGHSDAQDCYAYLLYYGYYGLDRSCDSAVYWWQKSADQGNASAQYNLGMCYYDGEGVEKDIDKAICLIKAAAEKGLENAINFLGIYYYDRASGAQTEITMYKDDNW
ncbi:MAG: tetratricopeptide repeat protein [Candidatus Cryptobacteroides sp.]